jgi:hypothetical protein
VIQQAKRKAIEIQAMQHTVKEPQLIQQMELLLQEVLAIQQQQFQAL